LAEGCYFHGIDSWERSLEFCVEELGEDLWLFATDWPHGDSAWPESVEQAAGRPRLTERSQKASRRKRDAALPATARLTPPRLLRFARNHTSNDVIARSRATKQSRREPR
jgi:hypothetical protein